MFRCIKDKARACVYIGVMAMMLAGATATAASASTMTNSQLFPAQHVRVTVTSMRLGPGQGAGQGLSPDAGGHSPGPCGSADLYAGTSGFYDLILNFNFQAGVPVAGNVVIHYADKSWGDSYLIGGGSRLSFSGVLGPPDTSDIKADGWAVTDRGWYCGIAVQAAQS